MRGRSALLVAAALGLASFAGAHSTAGQLIEKAAVRSTSSMRRSGSGRSNRHVQRMAAKKRNQARHRAACRGKRRSHA